MSHTLDRRLHLATLPNARDLGGLELAAGTVAPQRVLRSASLSGLAADDAQALTDLGLARVLDLRTDAERAAAPNRLPDHVSQGHLDVFADSSLNIGAQMTQFMADPSAALAAFSGTAAKDMLLSTYRELVNLPSAKSSYYRFFSDLADPQHTGATLFHCTAGKDRTGWAAAILLFTLGASYDTVLADYLKTNEDSSSALKPFFEQFAAQGIDPESLQAVVGVDQDYLDTALDLVSKQYGSVEGYVVSGLGVSEDTLETVRERLID